MSGVFVAEVEIGRSSSLQRFCSAARHPAAPLSLPRHPTIATEESHRHRRLMHSDISSSHLGINTAVYCVTFH